MFAIAFSTNVDFPSLFLLFFSSRIQIQNQHNFSRLPPSHLLVNHKTCNFCLQIIDQEILNANAIIQLEKEKFKLSFKQIETKYELVVLSNCLRFIALHQITSFQWYIYPIWFSTIGLIRFTWWYWASGSN